MLFSLLYLFIIALLWPVSASRANTLSVSVTGTASSENTGNNLDFTNYNSSVTIDGATGNFSGYGWSEDLGWIAFGTADNSEGPVQVNLTTGAVTGKAKVINTDHYLDFTNYNSNVAISTTTGSWSGYGWSEDLGWLDFTSVSVSTANLFDQTSPTGPTLISPTGYTNTNTQPARFTGLQLLVPPLLATLLV